MAAKVLSERGFRVVVLERGENYFTDLGGAGLPHSEFSNDELKFIHRRFVEPDPITEPRTFRTSEEDGPRLVVGDVNTTPATVGGASIAADPASRRLQKADFRMRTLLGDVPGADFRDWPLSYEDLAPHYDEVERIVGVQGRAGANPFEVPRGEYPMPPSLPAYGSWLAATAAERLGYHPFPTPTAVNSRPYRGRPPCNDCGFHGGYGCPIHAKGSAAVTALRDALRTGQCEVRADCFAFFVRTDTSGRRALGVEYIDPEGREQFQAAELVVLACSAIESVRLCLLSQSGKHPRGLGNSSGLLGKRIMFHFQTIAYGGPFQQRLHPHRGRSGLSHGFDDFTGKSAELALLEDRPVGGTVELGGTQHPISEALLQPWGLRHKQGMRSGVFRERLLVVTMQGEDAPQLTNAVDLDPDIKDVHGFPVARITYRSHPFEIEASRHYGPKLAQLIRAAGARSASYVTSPSTARLVPGGPAPIDIVPASRHILGGLWMGTDPATSICDPFGKFHDLDNVYCVDGGLFVTSTGMNPILTIWALAHRAAFHMGT